MAQFKAFDFKSGKSYLIGEFDSHAEALTYCKKQGFAVIPQTVVSLTVQEYEHALKNRIELTTTKYKYTLKKKEG